MKGIAGLFSKTTAANSTNHDTRSVGMAMLILGSVVLVLCHPPH
ncbi:MAG: hypothetical protein AB1521_11990 [Bacteroidota bacterium]